MSVIVDVHRGVEVVLPRTAPARAAAAAVDELAPWIRRRLAERERVHAALSRRGAAVPYLGRHLALVTQPGRTRVLRRGESLLVPAGEQLMGALERFYRQAARAEITPRLQRACAQAGVSYRRLAIRSQRTRWGSCSSSGTLSFNWRLLLAPEPVLDYVVWHEVCHLLVADHSPRFWALLEEHLPGYRQPRRWLRANGAMLVLQPSLSA